MSKVVKSRRSKCFVVLFGLSALAAVLIVTDGMERSTTARAADCWKKGYVTCAVCGVTAACSDSTCTLTATGYKCPIEGQGRTERVLPADNWVEACNASSTGYFTCTTGGTVFWCVQSFTCSGCTVPSGGADPVCVGIAPANHCGITAATFSGPGCPGG